VRQSSIEPERWSTIIVVNASRFARELVVQELGIALMAKRSINLLTASGDDLTDSDDLGSKMMRQVAGAFMERDYERRCVPGRGRRRVAANTYGVSALHRTDERGELFGQVGSIAR
jgi:DNA invertase Pin-like site-specific DNA recombinase